MHKEHKSQAAAYLGNDTIIEAFSPPQTGDYYIKIDTVEMNDVASYLLAVQIHEKDQDNDGHIACCLR